MLFSVASTLFQSTLGVVFDDLPITGDNTFTQCIYALLRVFLLTATFVLAQRTFKARNSPKVRALPCITKGTPRMPSARGRYPKKPIAPPIDDDDLSTSVGSSDSESDMTSSDNENETGSTIKISVSDLLRCRPAAGPAPVGSLRAMPVAERVPVSRQQFEQRQWENLRGPAVVQENPASAKPLKAAPAKSNPKPLKKNPRMDRVQAPVDAATAAANSARIAALLEIVCPEDVPAVAPMTAPKTGATPPWRR